MGSSARICGVCLIYAVFGAIAPAIAAGDGTLEAAIGCLRVQAAGLDDGISAPTAVAYGLMGLCGPQIERAIDSAMAQTPSGDRDRMRAQMTATMQKAATAVVLQHRAGQ